jgi:hypothetical protein
VAEILELMVPWLASIVLLFALLAWDESRMRPVERGRAWPPASLRIAVVVFGVVSLPVHFGRTRRTALGVLQGFAWAAALVVLQAGMAEGIDRLAGRFGWP